MAISLVKGQTIELKKTEFDLSTITIGLGWDVRDPKGTTSTTPEIEGPLGKYYGHQPDTFDLDAVAFLLDENDQVINVGFENQVNGTKVPLIKSDVVYFHNLTVPSGNLGAYGNQSKQQIMTRVKQFLLAGEYVIHTGDNLSGEGDGDDEQIIVRLDLIPPRIHKVLFMVCIFQGIKKEQHFGQVKNAFIRAIDGKGDEILRYPLSDSPDFNGMCSMLFAEVYRRGSDWKFRAVGEPRQTDQFLHILKDYLPKGKNL